MKEITGNLWDGWAELPQPIWRCITTNGIVKSDGCCVMGAGCALEAAIKFPNLPKELGSLIRANGNNAYVFPQYNIITFPTKQHYKDKSQIHLIGQSCMQLAVIARTTSGTFLLPRPGCGFGGLNYQTVKPVLLQHFKNLDNVLVIGM